ncbi:uncharacterized protein LOC124898643 [Capsicum annuum]|uniref:uncharacterized protein LOC124898643 n=1 Tax=Capsicum annuum TaxID=4072 RepID=UPI001FB0A090|nr:uncharacterized protein LOC124898643 [Capsicum annuum]
MNFLIWNCRGSNSLDFRKHFKDLLDLHNPALVVLLETYRMNHQTVPNEFRFSNVAACPGLGTSGGIAILWQADLLNVTDVAMTHQEIYCRIQVIPFPNKWLFSVVYAFNNKNDRLTLWDNLKLVADNFVGPWSIGDDFNEVCSSSEKFGGLPLSFSRANRFSKCLDYSHMVDLSYSGSKYTWSNLSRNNKVILERLDRCVANND